MDAYLASHPYQALGLFVWTIIWKGLALWKAARREHKLWFVIILILNTLGAVEILYFFLISESRWPFKKNGQNKSNNSSINADG